MHPQQPLFLLLIVGGLATALRPVQTNSLGGAWRLTDPSGATVLLTMTDNYLMQTVYEPNRYVSTRGGAYQVIGDKLTLSVEFDTKDSSRVGQSEPYQTTLRSGQLVISSPSGKQTFSQMEETATALTGLWRITGRANDAGQLTTIAAGATQDHQVIDGKPFSMGSYQSTDQTVFRNRRGYVYADRR